MIETFGASEGGNKGIDIAGSKDRQLSRPQMAALFMPVTRCAATVI
ncbi:hypothetical protein ACLB1T_04595 [Escherichia coli]